MKIAYLSARGGVSEAAIAAAAAHFQRAPIRGQYAIAYENVERKSLEIEGVDVNIIDTENQRPKLFLADMDSTMIGQECIDELADYAGVKAEISAITERAMQGELDFEEALRARVAMLEGLTERIMVRCYEDRIRPNAGAEALIEALGNAGAWRVLVSGGFTGFAGAIAERLGFDRYEANVLEEVSCTLTGSLVGGIVDQSAKKRILLEEAARLGVPAAKIVAIGDGANDLGMIEAAGIGVAYHAKPVLKSAADLVLDHSDLDALIDILALD